MKYFFDNRDKIKKTFAGRNFFLFLDCDGTLTPIVDKPKSVKLDAETKTILKKISENKKIIPAIISGRPLHEVKKMVGIKNIIYSGNHGFEMETQMFANKKSESPRIFVHPEAKKIMPVIRKIRPVLEKGLKDIKGAFVEDKGLILSIHWRSADKKYLPKLFALIRDTICDNSRVSLTKGKKVWEIRPNVNWNKGSAVKYILSLVPHPSSFVPVFVGDDATDEDAFKVLQKGITIRIGKSKESKARYYLKNQPEIKKFLNCLIA